EGTDTSVHVAPNGLASVTANFADNFSASNYGTDGAGSTTYTLKLTGLNVASGLYALDASDKSAAGVDGDGIGQGTQIVLNQVGNTITGSAGGTDYFTISIDPATGIVTFTQLSNIWQADPSNPDDPATLTLASADLLQVVKTVTDADGDSVTTPINLGAGVFTIQDDGPTAPTIAVSLNDPILLTFDGALTGGNFVGTQAVGDQNPSLLIAIQDYAGVFSINGTNYGTDGAGTTTFTSYALGFAAGFTPGDAGGHGTASGLTHNGSAIYLYNIGGVITGSTALTQGGVSGANTIFTISLSGSNVTLTQSGSIDHTTTSTYNGSYISDLQALAAGILVLTATAVSTDADGDQASSTASLDLGPQIRFGDDGPQVVTHTDLIYANGSNPTPGGTGVYVYNVGADQNTYTDAAHSDFAPITLTGTVGGVAITSPTVTWQSEDSHFATFGISFSYAPNPATPGVTIQDTGTLVFDKIAGTYTVELANPIQSVTVVNTSGANVHFQGYQDNSLNQDNSGPAPYVVAQLDTNFFVQFSGSHETNNPNVNLTSGTTNPGDGAYASDDLFWANPTDVTVSSSALGVASNTLQPGEVLNMNFYTADPHGIPGSQTTAYASGIYLEFFNIGSKDLVINLELVGAGSDGVFGTGDDVHTTKAVVVDNADIFTAANPPPAGYPVPTGTDGIVIIDSYDWNGAGQNYLLTGVQIVTSTQTLTGSGIDLVSAVGAAGASTGTESFGSVGANNTSDNDNIKITSAGFIETTTTTQDANLTFQVTNLDGDDDKTATQTLNVTIEGSTTFVGTSSDESIQGTTGNDVITGNGGNDVLTGNGGNDVFVLQGSSANGHDTLVDFNAGDSIVVDVANLNLTINTAQTVAFNSGTTGANDQTHDSAFAGSNFFFNTTTNELYYSDNNTAAHAVDLAHISTGIPQNNAVHVA
ncbi:hypothetical protein GGD63_003362, partial [Bradyrhizobium sp. cir1]|uniref:DUF5801 repeats-in-toxin domain-containing protein n=1 Tax=Bradyrhizobium sp. cir1 TaxID=1445730 RepID=UPI0017BEC76D